MMAPESRQSVEIVAIRAEQEVEHTVQIVGRVEGDADLPAVLAADRDADVRLQKASEPVFHAPDGDWYLGGGWTGALGGWLGGRTLLRRLGLERQPDSVLEVADAQPLR